MKNQKGFVWLPILLVILGIVVVGGGAYYFMHKNTASQMPIYQPTETTQPIQASTHNIPTHPTQNTIVAPSTTNNPLTASPSSETRGQPITFSTSYGGQTGTAYYVDFGDNSLDWYACGQTISNEQVNESCLPTTFQHTYAGSGTYAYTVTLHKYNGSFNNSPVVGTAAVTVNGADTLPPPTCTLTASPSTTTVGQKITISWTTQKANSGGPSGYGAWLGLGGGDSILTQMVTPASLNGSQTVTAEKADSETLGFAINGPGGSGEGRCSVVVTVTDNQVAPPSIKLSIDPIISTSPNPTFTGSATGVSSVAIDFIVSAPASFTGSKSHGGATVSVVNGRWTYTSPSNFFEPGNYTIQLDPTGEPIPSSYTATSTFSVSSSGQ
jgi:hypothetical protein